MIKLYCPPSHILDMLNYNLLYLIFLGMGNFTLECGSPDNDQFRKNIAFIFEGVLSLLSAIIGIIGNLTCLYVLIKPSLRNILFNQLIIALACFDTLYLIIGGINFLPRAFDASFDWYTIILPNFIHPFNQIFMSCSIFMTVAITIERFIGICYPLRSRNVKRKSGFYIAAVVILSFSVNITKFAELKTIWSARNKDDNETDMENNEIVLVPDYVATSLRLNENYILYFMTFNTFLHTIIPAIILFALNSKILISINSVRFQQLRSTNRLRREKKLFWILFSIVLIFFMCHLPKGVIDLWEVVHIKKSLACQKANMWFYWPTWIMNIMTVSNFLIFVNSSVNFLIYLLVDRDFRKECFSSFSCTDTDASKALQCNSSYSGERRHAVRRRKFSSQNKQITVNGNCFLIQFSEMPTMRNEKAKVDPNKPTNLRQYLNMSRPVSVRRVETRKFTVDDITLCERKLVDRPKEWTQIYPNLDQPNGIVAW